MVGFSVVLVRVGVLIREFRLDKVLAFDGMGYLLYEGNVQKNVSSLMP